MKRVFSLVVLTGLLIYSCAVYAVQLEALDSAKEWRVEAIELSGNKLFSTEDLLGEMITKARSWYRLWAERPIFDPIAFKSDLERLRRFYESRGYYSAEVTYDLDARDEEGLITARTSVREGLPVVISEIHVDVSDETPNPGWPSLPTSLPIKRGDVFEEKHYQEAEQTLRSLFLRHAFAHVETQRRAEVDLERRQVRIDYFVRPGPLTVFGATEVAGTVAVDSALVLRELTYQAGEAFSPEKIAESRAKILGLNLFSSVRIGPKSTSGNPRVVPLDIEVVEKSHREIKVALGYSTEDQLRAQLEWRHLNWLGGGRQLSILGKYSGITAGGEINLIQPHLFSPRTKAVLGFKHHQEDEQTFLRNATRFTPRIDHQFNSDLTGFLDYRVEFNKLNDIAPATVAALGGVRREGILSGPSLGLVWKTTDDLFAPKRGEVLSFKVEQAGAIWGGPYSFYKITGEAKKYFELGWDTVLASRLKIGLGDAIGSKDRFPLFERFFAGGEKSVRGYARRRLGPLSASNDPLGGLSLIEGSIELRRPIWKELSGAVFMDFGQVSKRSFDLRVGDLKFSSGFGLSYNTPVGPLRLDVGFPFERPRGDRPWQIHFSIGAFF